MNKRLFYFFVLISCFAVSGTTALASIIVEDATIIWEEALKPPTELIELSENVAPRIIVEYATTIYQDNLDKPTKLIEASEKVRSRIIVVYAPTVFKENLIYPFEPIPGDFSRNGLVDLGDAIRVLKMLCGDTTYTVYKEAEVSGDGKVGAEEAVHILREIAGK